HCTVWRKSMRSGRPAWMSAEASISFCWWRVSVRCSGGRVTGRPACRREGAARPGEGTGVASGVLPVQLGDAGHAAVAEDAGQFLEQVVVHLAPLVEGQPAELLVDRLGHVDRLLLVPLLVGQPGAVFRRRRALAVGRVAQEAESVAA